MLRRWGHGHSLGGGFLGGLALASYREWLLMALCVLLGMTIEWFRRTASTLADHFLWNRRRRLAAGRGVAVRTERVSAQDDPRPLLGDE